MDILTELNRAMVYIEEQIEDDIALTEVSKVTSYSPYRFGRLFYYIADMPLSEYIRKRKLSMAAMKLQSSDIKVIDLAVLYGYDSADSFSRAFACCLYRKKIRWTKCRNNGMLALPTNIHFGHVRSAFERWAK